MTSTLRRASKDLPELDRTRGLDALFRLHDALLRRLCVRWTRGHQADAQDLLAEAYLRVVRNRGHDQPLPDNPIAWLSAIIANLARDQLRAKSRSIGSRARGDDDPASLCDPKSDSDKTFIARELLSETLKRVQNLSATQRRALLARSTGEEYEVIAAQLATTPANVRKLVQMARSELRAQLSPQERMLIAGKRKHSPHAAHARS